MSNQSSKQYEMKGQYTPENSALVLIDHQVGTLTFVHNMSSDESLRNAIMLAKAAKAYGMPVVLTTSQEDHPQGRRRLQRCRKTPRVNPCDDNLPTPHAPRAGNALAQPLLLSPMPLLRSS